MKKLIILGTVLLFATASGKAQHSISGYIVSLETTKPIANATVFLNNKYNLPFEDSDSIKVTTDSVGFYNISGIKAGTYIANAWTNYRAMDQQYALVLASDRIKIDRSINIDFVFSENAFKYKLDYKFRLKEAYKSRETAKAFLKPRERSSDTVARRAVYPHLYIDSERVPLLTWYIEKHKKY